jgi:zinc protease
MFIYSVGTKPSGAGGDGMSKKCAGHAQLHRILLDGKSAGWRFVAVFFLAALLACAPQEPHPKVLRATLDNGLRVVMVPDPLAPVATIVVNYLVGSNEAPPGFPGTAHAQEHMMFRGSPGLSAEQLADLTAAMGGIFDADTQQTVTQYFFAVPAAELEVALHIEAIRMRGVLDTERLWRQERGAIEQEVARDLSDPEYVMYTHLLADMFQGTPYAHTPLGTKVSFDKTTGPMLKKFYDDWYAPNNAILVVAGKVDPHKTLAAIKKLFGPIPKKNLPPRVPIHLRPVTPAMIRLKTDSPYGLVLVSMRMPGFNSPDYAAARVLATVLNSQRGNLYDLAATGKALATGFASSPLPQTGLGYAVAAFPKGGQAQTLLRQVKEVLAAYVKNGFPADLVSAAQKRELAEAEFQKNSVTGLAMAWSRALAVEGRQSPEDNVKAVGKVTVGEVDRVARRYLDLDRAAVAILTPESSGKPLAAKGFGGREVIKLKPAGTVTLPQWATQALNRLAVPASTVHPVVSNLPNGIKLIVQPESVSDTIGVYGHVKNQPDLHTPPGQEGVDQVLDHLFSYGTTSLDRLAFQKALDEIAAQVSAGTSFALQVVSKHFERAVQLLADNELHPALPERDFEIVHSQVAAAVAGRLQSPDYLADRALKEALFPKSDPTLRQPTPASISSLSLENVKDYFAKVVRPDETTIVVIGKVTPERARAVVERWFGQWQATGPKPETLLPPVPPNAPTTVAVPDSSRVQDKVILAETVGLTRGNPDYYALVLGNHVLGGGFYATRLYQQLREETGLVYNVGVELEANQTRAVYAVDYGCDPHNVGRARAIVERNLAVMQTRLVQPDELRQAKAILLRQIPLAESSLESIAQGLLSRSALNLPLDEPTLAAHRYLAMTAEQVKEAFATWVRTGGLVQVTQGPSPD